MARAILLGMLLGRCFFAGAQSNETNSQHPSAHYNLNFWAEAQGSSLTRIRAITQTRDGYLWLGTGAGLVRFDGLNFTVFNLQNGSLRDNEVWALKEDAAGRLWIATFAGGLTVYENDRFTYYTKTNGLPEDSVRSLALDQAGNLWVATHGGLARFSRGAFKTFSTKDGLASELVDKVCVGGQGEVWVLADFKVHRLAGERFAVQSSLAAPAEGRVMNLCEGRNGALWLSFESGLIKKLAGSTVTAFPPKAEYKGYSGNVSEDAQGNVWLGSHWGLLRLKDGAFVPALSRANEARLGPVYQTFTDAEGNLWLGLEADGLAQMRATRFAVVNAEDGLPGEDARTVMEDRQGNLWMGTSGGLAKWSQDHFTTFTEVEGQPLRMVNALAEDREGTLWVGTVRALYQLKGGQLRRDTTWQEGMEIRTLYADAYGRMWIGTARNGVFLHDQGKFKAFGGEVGLPQEKTRGILCDRTGGIWIATLGKGVIRYAQGKFSTYTTTDELADNKVTSIAEDSEGSIWFATRRGLSRFQDGKLRSFRSTDGLPYEWISAVLYDGRGKLWCSCSEGLFSVALADFRDYTTGKLETLNPQVYGTKDGLAGPAFVPGLQPSTWRAADGSLYFCSVKGLVVVQPNELPKNTQVPFVRIESFLADQRVRTPQAILSLAPGTRDVEIRYTALSLTAPERVRFKYQLTGLEEEWIDAGARRFAHYGGLPAGEYVFRVKACNNDGVWNETGACVAFAMEPHYYETWWFRGLCLAALAGVPLAFYTGRLKEYKARQKELQQAVDKAVAAVKAERLQNEEALQAKARLQALLADISARYINLPLETIDAALDGSIVELAEHVEADRVRVYDYDFLRQIATVARQWHREGLEAVTHVGQEFPLAAFPDWNVKAHERGETIWIPDIAELPPGALRTFGEKQSLKSLLAVPIMKGTQCLGFISFGWGRRHHRLDGEEQVLLKAFAGLWVNIRQRKQTEEALRESESRFQKLFDSAADAVFVHDQAGRIFDVNRAACESTGYTRQELLRMTVMDLECSVALGKSVEIWERVSRGEDMIVEGLQRRRDGSTFPVELHLASFTLGGEVLVFASARDIAERQRNERLVQARLRLLQYSFDHGLEELLTATLDEAEALTGSKVGFYHFLEADQKTLSLQAWSTRTAKEMCRAEGNPRHYDVAEAGVWVDCIHQRKAVVHNNYESLPHRKGLPSGHAPVVRELIVPVFRGGLIVAVLGVGNKAQDYDDNDVRTLTHVADMAWDIVERQRAEAALSASEHRYHLILQTAMDGFVRLDSQGSILDVNDAYCHMSGYRKEELLVLHLGNLEVTAAPNQVTARLQKVFAAGEDRYETKHRRKDGAVYDVEVSMQYRPKDDGLIVAFLRDVTARNQLQQQLLQAQKMDAIGQLAGGVAHDFNNILAATIMNLDLLEASPELSGETREHLKEVHALSDRAANLTRQLLMFSRRSVLEVGVLDLNQVVANLLRMLGRLLGEHIALVFEPHPKLPSLAADLGKLEQVIMNLCINARDAMPRGGRIRISTFAVNYGAEPAASPPGCLPGQYVCVSVSDTGCGMDEATKKRIFEPFFTTKEFGRGAGLGLATAHGIVAQHRGWIEVESEPGHGSTFRVFLPASSARPAELPPDKKPPLTGGKEGILLVEDEESVRRATAQALRRLGYGVFEAMHAPEALKIWEANHHAISLLLTDMMMPEGMTGLELAQKLRQEAPALRIIICSGYNTEAEAFSDPAHAGIKCLQKPYAIKDLSQAVRQCLDQAAG